MDKINTNSGFNGRVFLTKSECETYKKRKPVRYIKKKKQNLCEVCRKPAEVKTHLRILTL